MNRKITVFTLCGVLFVTCFYAESEESEKIPRIGFLATTGNPKAPGHQVAAFRQGLNELGYIEGKNILVEYRYIQYDTSRNPTLVAELVQLKVDVLVLLASPASAQPRRRLRRSLLSWSLHRILWRLGLS